MTNKKEVNKKIIDHEVERHLVVSTNTNALGLHLLQVSYRVS